MCIIHLLVGLVCAAQIERELDRQQAQQRAQAGRALREKKEERHRLAQLESASAANTSVVKPVIKPDDKIQYVVCVCKT